jgi:LmbE family N-acetylglucosaminyl deacetylase
MCIAAHPDDEDGTSLIVMRRKYGAHTVSLFSTFGEGGQNAIGPELYEELGAIRARETIAAAEIQGSEPHFLGLKDFGYSKSADEAFRFWGHEEALRRMVLEIRKLRPDVIITNHSVTNNDHGHHQATARLELEAFDAAADPKRFPEQLKDGVTVWQVQRLFVRAARSNQAQADTALTVTIDPNEHDPIRNATFAEEALSALQKHATQGPWPKTVTELAMRFRGSPDGKLPVTRYVLMKEAKGAAALTKDTHNFLDGLLLPDDVGKGLAAPTIDGKPLPDFADQRERVLDALVAASRQNPFGKFFDSKKVIVDQRRTRKQIELYTALGIASGISTRLTSTREVLIPGESSSFELELKNGGTHALHAQLNEISSGTGKDYVMLTPQRTANLAIPAGESVQVQLVAKTPSSSPLTVPHAKHLYDEGYAGATVVAAVRIDLNGIQFPLVVHRVSDIAPPVEILSAEPSLLVLTPQTDARPLSFRISVKSHLADPINTSVGALANSEGAKGLSLAEAIVPLAPGESRDLSMDAKIKVQSFSNIELSARFEKGKTRLLVARITVPVIKTDARVASGIRVGYIRGFDFSLPNALNALGVESKELSVDEVKSADLQKYTSIIVDNRVYESTPGLIAANQKLLDYAKAGGTLIVFYHKSFEWNPDERRKRPQLAPYKLILGDERITDETAPITFLEPQHPLLNSPNKMGQEDFAGWIQERGLYYPKEWDPQFQALLQSNDPGEAPLKGGLLVADYGRGKYIYTSMVWYRELRGGVPGAYRMLANMISYGQAK